MKGHFNMKIESDGSWIISGHCIDCGSPIYSRCIVGFPHRVPLTTRSCSCNAFSVILKAGSDPADDMIKDILNSS
jgi:hypothetical protein